MIALCKLLAIESRVRVSDGKASQGAESIMDAIKFAGRISDGGLIDVMSAHAKHHIALGSLSTALHKLDLASTSELRRFFEQKAKSKSPFASAMKLDIGKTVRDARSHLDEIAKESNYWTPPPELVKATHTQRAEYSKRLSEEFALLESQIDPLFAREERFWRFNPTSKDPIVNYALSISPLKDMPQIAARYRTQFRLAALHCRVIEFKRNNNRWPENLEELGGREVWYDPASGGKFYYAKLSNQSYTLYSLGSPETGRIDLVWRGPPDD
ncbi:MAG: hypothetical protein ABIV13_03815 [Fimbriimonadales bacterium]